MVWWAILELALEIVAILFLTTISQNILCGLNLPAISLERGLVTIRQSLPQWITLHVIEGLHIIWNIMNHLHSNICNLKKKWAFVQEYRYNIETDASKQRMAKESNLELAIEEIESEVKILPTYNIRHRLIYGWFFAKQNTDKPHRTEKIKG